MIDKIKAWCWHSLTVGWAYLVGACSALVLVAVQLADVLALPEIKAQMSAVVDTKTAAVIGLVVSVVTVFTRLRSLGKK